MNNIYSNIIVDNIDNNSDNNIDNNSDNNIDNNNDNNIDNNSDNSNDNNINHKIEECNNILFQKRLYYKNNKKNITVEQIKDVKREIHNLQIQIYRLKNKEKLKEQLYNNYHNIKKLNPDYMKYMRDYYRVKREQNLIIKNEEYFNEVGIKILSSF